MARKSAAAAAPPSPTPSDATTTSGDEDEYEHIASTPNPAAAAAASSESESGSDEDDEVAPPPISNRKPAPTAAASSDDDESSGDEDEDDEPAPVNPTPKPAAVTPTPKPAAASSSSEEESDDEEPPLPPPVNPPTAAAEPSESESSEEHPAIAATKTAASESDSDDESESDDQANNPIEKAAEATPATSARTANGTFFQRKFSDEDETAILRGLLDYKTETGKLPSRSDMTVVNESLPQIKMTNTQLAEKVRRMKRKYEITYEKNPSPVFAKPHDAEVYELSQKLWGASGVVSENDIVGGSVSNKRRKTAGGEFKMNGVDVTELYPSLTRAILSTGNSALASVQVKDAIAFLGEAKANALEAKCRKLELQHVKHHLYELNLARESLKFPMEALGLKG